MGGSDAIGKGKTPYWVQVVNALRTGAFLLSQQGLAQVKAPAHLIAVLGLGFFLEEYFHPSLMVLLSPIDFLTAGKRARRQ